jgi:hypothetical protein
VSIGQAFTDDNNRGRIDAAKLRDRIVADFEGEAQTGAIA